ncbi:hypothetical protein SJAG_00351 [Schizosaccharomyces japonicus yFS275]|uniref:Uncharacterized protein n=1 Tax=Schizosaccharomyces japonicus (strain yFS275 / FY16936) TaxID=402676 RepID=B6JVE3_SCHJY|nr:hypothetical protein SJAG_00351 [Schizosaccharomyces japonicus yFS275]EEB05344.1 hypothetical protein SJAG_00351 [Schizosaccharomyces japonicus yFS275]
MKETPPGTNDRALIVSLDWIVWNYIDTLLHERAVELQQNLPLAGQSVSNMRQLQDDEEQSSVRGFHQSERVGRMLETFEELTDKVVELHEENPSHILVTRSLLAYFLGQFSDCPLMESSSTSTSGPSGLRSNAREWCERPCIPVNNSESFTGYASLQQIRLPVRIEPILLRLVPNTSMQEDPFTGTQRSAFQLLNMYMNVLNSILPSNSSPELLDFCRSSLVKLTEYLAYTSVFINERIDLAEVAQLLSWTECPSIPCVRLLYVDCEDGETFLSQVKRSHSRLIEKLHVLLHQDSDALSRAAHRTAVNLGRLRIELNEQFYAIFSRLKPLPLGQICGLLWAFYD